MSAKGKFIVFEGPDSSGKSTMSKQITEWLNNNGTKAIHTRHPGSTTIGMKLRALAVESHTPIDPHTRGMLFAADNVAFINEILRPSLDAGTWVIADRNNFISSMAYQIADGVPLSGLDKIHDATIGVGAPLIDLLLVFRVSYDTLQKRLVARPEAEQTDSYQKKLAEQSYFDKIMGVYENLVQNESSRLLKFVKPTTGLGVPWPPLPRCLYIDANGTKEEVFETLLEVIQTERQIET